MPKEEEINKIIEYISYEMYKVEHEKTSKNEKLEKADVLYKMYRIATNLDELTPTLEKFFEEKHKKEKYGGEKDGR